MLARPSPSGAGRDDDLEPAIGDLHVDEDAFSYELGENEGIGAAVIAALRHYGCSPSRPVYGKGDTLVKRVADAHGITDTRRVTQGTVFTIPRDLLTRER